MEFDVETIANCQTVDESYVFIHQPYLLYPNPVQDQMQIKQNKKFIEISSRFNQKSNQYHKLTIYDQYEKILFESKLKSDFDFYSFDASGLKSGWYFVEMTNPFFTKTYKFQKL